MGVPISTKQLLSQKSGNRCAKPDCNNRLSEAATALDGEVGLGEIAHIVSQSDDGPRANKSMPQEERDGIDNLILLCREHHRIADRQENTYTVDELRQWKRQHESLVEQQMEALAPEISFVELEIVAEGVIASPVEETPGFKITEVRSKMEKNSLSDRVSRDMSNGMVGAEVVREFIAQRLTMNPDFAERLQGGFVAEYERLYAGGLRGDDLFIALRNFAAAPHLELPRQIAGLAVLVHLFRICQVFEP